MRNLLNNEYFEWLFNLVCEGRFAKDISFRRLLIYLHTTEFIYPLRRDESRAEDGVDLRYRFSKTFNYDELPEVGSPCSVLEMMVALALRCEEAIMDDPQYGGRMQQWFWGMITNLGLGYMTDEEFDRHLVDSIIQKFLKRDYEPDGTGGLFTVKDSGHDLRRFEIWYQMCWYLNSIT